MKHYIIEELQYRNMLNGALDATIERYLARAPGKRLKRGPVQELIMAALDLPRTTDLCRLINERMTIAGFPPYIMKGTLYYRNCHLS